MSSSIWDFAGQSVLTTSDRIHPIHETILVNDPNIPWGSSHNVVFDEQNSKEVYEVLHDSPDKRNDIEIRELLYANSFSGNALVTSNDCMVNADPEIAYSSRQVFGVPLPFSEGVIQSKHYLPTAQSFHILVYAGLTAIVCKSNVGSTSIFVPSIMINRPSAVWATKIVYDTEFLTNFDTGIHFGNITLDETPDWLRAMQRGQTSVIPKGELGKAFLAIRDAAVKHEYQKIDIWLAAAAPEKMRLESLIALLRYPYAYRRKLKGWKGFLERAKKEVMRRGGDPSSVFPGLDAD